MRHPGTVEAILTRLRRLERANRALLVGGLGLGAMLLAGAAAQTGDPDVLRARGVEIVDENGAVQIRLSASTEGPKIDLLDSAGVARATLQHDAEGTALYIRDATGTTRLGAAQFAHGGGGYALHGEDAKGAAVLYLKSGKGSLRFFSPEGAVTAQFPAQP